MFDAILRDPEAGTEAMDLYLSHIMIEIAVKFFAENDGFDVLIDALSDGQPSTYRDISTALYEHMDALTDDRAAATIARIVPLLETMDFQYNSNGPEAQIHNGTIVKFRELVKHAESVLPRERLDDQLLRRINSAVEHGGPGPK